LLFACGIVLNLRSGLGLGPWDVLHQGISLRTPLSFGQASQVIGVLVIGVGLALRVRPGVVTLLNMALIGYFVDRILDSGAIPDATQYGLAVQLAVDLLGVLVVGLGSALYIRANLGADPRDGLMLGLHRLTGWRIALTRGLLELCVAGSGVALGGSLGAGTLIFAIGIGPAVEFGFRLFGLPQDHGTTKPGTICT
jgi:uncharacterized membrane protein YczE